MMADGTRHAQWRGQRVIVSEAGSPVAGLITSSSHVSGRATFLAAMSGQGDVTMTTLQAAAAIECYKAQEQMCARQGVLPEQQLVQRAGEAVRDRGKFAFRSEYGKLTKAQKDCLDGVFPTLDERYATDDASLFAGIFQCDNGALVKTLRVALRSKVGNQCREGLDDSAYFDKHFGEQFEDHMWERHKFRCTRELAMKAAYAVPGAITTFAVFIAAPSQAEDESFGKDVERSDDYICLTDGQVRSISPAPKDTRKAKTLSSPALVRAAAAIWIDILRWAHGDEVLQKTRCLSDALQDMQTRSVLNAEAMVKVLEKAYKGFQRSLTECVRVAMRGDPDSAPHGYCLKDVVRRELQLLPPDFIEDSAIKIAGDAERVRMRTEAARLRDELAASKAARTAAEARMAAIEKGASQGNNASGSAKKTRRAAAKAANNAGPAGGAATGRTATKKKQQRGGGGGGSGAGGGGAAGSAEQVLGKRLADLAGVHAAELVKRLKAKGYAKAADAIAKNRTPGSKQCYWASAEGRAMLPDDSLKNPCPYGALCTFDH